MGETTRTVTLLPVFLAAFLFTTTAHSDWTDVPDAGEGRCVSGCGDSSPSTSWGNLFRGSDEEVYTPSPQEIATGHNNTGVEFYNSGNYAAALDEFETAYRLNPESEIVRKNLANTLMQLAAKTSDPEEERSLLQRAQGLAPDTTEIRDRLTAAEERVADRERMGRAKVKIDRMLDDFAAQFADPSSPAVDSGKATTGGGSPNPSGDSNVVDLTFLDPSKPIVVDPNVAKGKPRISAVQPAGDPQKNASYKEGFEALKKRDPAAAVALFEKAARELPGDPLVKYALLLAQDLKGVRDRENQTEARRSASEAIRALQENDTGRAVELLREASRKDPSDLNIQDTLQFVEGLHAEARAANEEAVAAQKEEAAAVGALGARALIDGDRKGAAALLSEAAATRADNGEIGKLRRHLAPKPGEEDDAWTGEIRKTDVQDSAGKQRITQEENYEDSAHKLTIQTEHENGVTTQTVIQVDKRTWEVTRETSDDRAAPPAPPPSSGGGLDFLR
jgi:tetratricopeptide (TPR) repeat protein